MAEWEHLACGSLNAGNSGAPPASCWYCLSIDIRVGQQVPGWRFISNKPVQQLPARCRGWECLSCGQVVKQKRRPAQCSSCYRLSNYVPAFDEIRVKVKTKRRRAAPSQVTPSNREIVFDRDGHACVNCGEDDPKLLTLDHIRPKSKGGTNRIDNLQVLCRDCNGRKADAIPPKGYTYPPELAAA